MSEAWWGREASANHRPTQQLAEDGLRPQLLPPGRKAVADEIRAKSLTFTPEWTSRAPTDAGVALVRLYSEQMEPAVARLNQLPDKAIVEFLNVAGVSPLPATPAKALIEFEIDEKSPYPVLVAEGFQLSARANGELVFFETESTLDGAPGKIAEMYTLIGATVLPADLEGFHPFGVKGNGMFLIGLSGNGMPGPTLSLYLQLVEKPGAPPPVAKGGIAPLPLPPSPLIEWEVLDGGHAEPAEVVVDETRSLTQSGLLTLRLPRQWRPYRAVAGDQPLRWLRLRIVNGVYREAPKLAFVRLNMVRAVAARTLRDDVLQEVPGSSGRRWTLSQKPVVPHSLILEVDEGGTDEEPVRQRWTEVASLVDARAGDKVFVLDPGSGTVTFGDGRHGEGPPQGFRHIRAVSYQAGGGKAGAVDTGAVSNLVNSLPFLKGAKNPFPARGGQDQEAQDEAVARGPQELRTRERAVTTADYALLARRASGALVARAHAVSGMHPAFPGRPTPGVVAVIVLPPCTQETLPIPDQQTLDAVAAHLSTEAVPAGVEVVAAAPRYHQIRVEAGIVIDASANAGETVSNVMKKLDGYLHPLTGGQDGKGWPFGGLVVYTDLLQQVNHIAGVRAVRNLNLVVDGARVPACRDHAISPHGLLWPEGHEIVIAGLE